MTNRIVLGVDIGGSHITAMLVNLENGEVLKKSEVGEQVNSKGSVTEIIAQWSNVIKKVFEIQKFDITKIGIAMPGPFDYKKGIAWMKDQDKYDSLYGLNVKELLARSLNIPAQNIRFINDAESFLKGEVFSGAAKKSTKAIGLTLGTGFGSAWYISGIVEDAELWRKPFLNGIAEDYLSTRWFVARYATLAGITLSGVKELAELARNKNALGLQTFKEFGYNLSLFLKDIMQNPRPQTIVVGGNIANAFDLFSNEVDKQLKDLSYKPSFQKALLGEEAALIGAASCWYEVGEKVLASVDV